MSSSKMLRSENETLYDPQVRDTYFIEMIITYIDTQPSLVVVSDVLLRTGINSLQNDLIVLQAYQYLLII